MNQIKALKEERGRLIGELQTLQNNIEKEARSMSDSETARFAEIDSRLNFISAEVEKLEKLQARAAEAANLAGAASTSEAREKNKMGEQYSFKRAIQMAATGRKEGVEAEFSKIAADEFQRSGVSVAAHSVLIPSEVFKRDMTATGGTGGDQGGVNIQQVLVASLMCCCQRPFCAVWAFSS